MYKRWYLCHRDFRFLPHTFKQLGTETYPPFIPYGSTRARISSAALFVKVTASTSFGFRIAVADEVRDTAGDDARLAGSGPGEDQQRSFDVKDRFALFGI